MTELGTTAKLAALMPPDSTPCQRCSVQGNEVFFNLCPHCRELVGRYVLCTGCAEQFVSFLSEGHPLLRARTCADPPPSQVREPETHAGRR
jgi:hypothetical protein